MTIMVTSKEYEEHYPGNYVYFNGKYYSSIDSLIKECKELGYFDEIYAFGTVKERIGLDAESIIDDFECDDRLPNNYETCEESKKEIKEFVNKWNEKYAFDEYYINDKLRIVVRLDDKTENTDDCTERKLKLDKISEFREATRPAIEWMQKNCCPHDKIIIDIGKAEFTNGNMFYTVDVPD